MPRIDALRTLPRKVKGFPMESFKDMAIARFMREYGAVSYRETENGDVILSGKGKKPLQYKVSARDVSQVMKRVEASQNPYRYELRATALGSRQKSRALKPDPGKRIG